MSNDLFSANNKLATVMQDLGYTSTADENAFRTVLRQFADIKERDVAEVCPRLPYRLSLCCLLGDLHALGLRRGHYHVCSTPKSPS